jgi:hypothetical protein
MRQNRSLAPCASSVCSDEHTGATFSFAWDRGSSLIAAEGHVSTPRTHIDLTESARSPDKTNIPPRNSDRSVSSALLSIYPSIEKHQAPAFGGFLVGETQ